MPAPIFAISRHRIPIDGQGVTTLVTFSHCPLRCKYCLNPQCEDDTMLHNLQLLSERGLQERCLIRVPLIPEFNNPEFQAESQQQLESMGFRHIEMFEYIRK